MVASRESFLKPRIVKDFLVHYDGSPIPPRRDIAENVLEEMGVPTESKASTLDFIVGEAKQLKLVEEIKDKIYVSLDGAAMTAHTDESSVDDSEQGEPDKPKELVHAYIKENKPAEDVGKHDYGTTTGTNRRVFITHGKNKGLIEPIKKLLGFGELQQVVSVEKQTVSLSVPDKVMSDMRSCGAAIIHVEDELRLIDSSAKEHVVLNPNVLIEIGAAMALFGKRFILIVKEGVELPSNLQGLYQVRYRGETLDGDATIRLLESINDIKNHPIPDRYSTST